MAISWRINTEHNLKQGPKGGGSRDRYLARFRVATDEWARLPQTSLVRPPVQHLNVTQVKWATLRLIEVV